jgi:hypothetical protein
LNLRKDKLRSMKQSFVESLIAAAVCTSLLFLTINFSTAQVRSSSNYQLQSDSINIGGGFSSSTNYVQESTVGEVATGNSDSSNYNLYAGYQQLQEVYISISDPTDVIMSPNLPGLTGGTSNGSTTVTVTTDSPAGYSLTIEAQNNPAMQSGGNTIANYNEGAEPDFSFTTSGSQAHFGFSPSGVDLVQEFKDGGGLCNVNTQDTLLACWAGLTTSDREIARSISPNHPAGATTTVFFRVGVGGSVGVPSGVYTATTTLTALSL